MSDGNPDASAQNPKKIHEGRQASAGAGTADDLSAERAECQHAQFECLQAERDSNQSDYQQETADNIFEADDEASEYEP